MSYNVISYYITSYYIILYHITSYHITVYYYIHLVHHIHTNYLLYMYISCFICIVICIYLSNAALEKIEISIF